LRLIKKLKKIGDKKKNSEIRSIINIRNNKKMRNKREREKAEVIFISNYVFIVDA
jgi:hypothetical protein